MNVDDSEMSDAKRCRAAARVKTTGPVRVGKLIIEQHRDMRSDKKDGNTRFVFKIPGNPLLRWGGKLRKHGNLSPLELNYKIWKNWMVSSYSIGKTQ